MQVKRVRVLSNAGASAVHFRPMTDNYSTCAQDMQAHKIFTANCNSITCNFSRQHVVNSPSRISVTRRGGWKCVSVNEARPNLLGGEDWMAGDGWTCLGGTLHLERQGTRNRQRGAKNQ
eukprot:scaffold23490_cov149-Skeletonema_dohrnii-CCMP3373.AAC.1